MYQHRSVYPPVTVYAVTTGRTEEAVEKMLEPLSGAAPDPELWALTMAAHQPGSAGHAYRGYTVSGSDTVHTEVTMTTINRLPCSVVLLICPRRAPALLPLCSVCAATVLP